jgi:hypothetical protein
MMSNFDHCALGYDLFTLKSIIEPTANCYFLIRALMGTVEKWLDIYLNNRYITP